ncbi:NISCHARIN RELATED [Salix koriyanagi]|uniref:NISCHARIN RELATED n=1 Tax=Salix koriyanagi TaxID=2511006 RepID=A0A9Q0PGF0_9ROSI|nr:NISCHARIN RELATED [Salix koriyanagi]
MAVVTGDRYLEKLVKFVEEQAGPLIEGVLVLKLNPDGLRYVNSRLESLHELENLLSGAPVDYLRAYISDLGDHRALEQLRRILRLLTELKVFSVSPPTRDPTPVCLVPFGRLKVLELRGCDLSTSAAKGLLELRHTLEKIVCHNSTDALRHVFASRIMEIKDSPQWNRLSFVSCACNRLVLMDESLQLLPAVETLDLSRNKFAKVDNLRKCTKLKHLDLGFNHLRSVAPLCEISCYIVNLVLRNNALTTLHGLENLKSLEALDVSYNIISNFSELEFLTVLPCLRNLWLEGNPLCGARWYRAQVFGYVVHPEAVKLDDQEISAREFWKRQIIISRRQKRPVSFEFYSPAIGDDEGDVNINWKRRKVSRLASIANKEETMCISSDQESPSCDNEIQRKEENDISDDEGEIVDLINRVELMKKEHSSLWLREFKDWMDHESENNVDCSGYCGVTLHHTKENHPTNKSTQKDHCYSSRDSMDDLQASGDETSTNIHKPDSSFVNTGSYGGVALPGMVNMNLRQKHQKSYLHGGSGSMSVQGRSSHTDSSTVQGVQTIDENRSISLLTTLSSPAYPRSPPHYEEDILQRRNNFVEEILQLSAESYSVASSNSNTSSSDDDIYEFGDSSYEADKSQNEQYLNPKAGGQLSSNSLKDEVHRTHHVMENDSYLNDSQTSNSTKHLRSNSNLSAGSHDGEIAHFAYQEADMLEKGINIRKPRRRVISLLENMVGRIGRPENLNGNGDTCGADLVDGQGEQIIIESDFHVTDKKQLQTNFLTTLDAVNVNGFSDDFIENYFNENVADSRINESCRNYMRCDCVLEPESMYREREVVLLLSSEDKLYVLLIDAAFDGSGSILSLLGWHRVDDVREVLVGIGLQVMSVYIERGATYLFLTRSIEKSRKLLHILQVCGPCATNNKCLLRSLEQVQVELFEQQICRGLKLSIFQYSMVHFWHKKNEEDSWLPRSLFVSGGHVLLCVEDLKQFGSSSGNASSPPYFLLDSCCSISDVSELVIEARESWFITIVLQHATKRFCLPSKSQKNIKKNDKDNEGSGSLKWNLKWSSKENLFNFVALLRAFHAEVATLPMLVTYTM